MTGSFQSHQKTDGSSSVSAGNEEHFCIDAPLDSAPTHDVRRVKPSVVRDIAYNMQLKHQDIYRRQCLALSNYKARHGTYEANLKRDEYNKLNSSRPEGWFGPNHVHED